jgi:hypothetical protein
MKSLSLNLKKLSILFPAWRSGRVGRLSEAWNLLINYPAVTRGSFAHEACASWLRMTVLFEVACLNYSFLKSNINE